MRNTGDGMTAARRFLEARVKLLEEHGKRTPCSFTSDDNNPWTSEDADDRAAAALSCGPCPLLALCSDFADEIGASWYVYGGVDRSPKPKTRKAAS